MRIISDFTTDMYNFLKHLMMPAKGTYVLEFVICPILMIHVLISRVDGSIWPMVWVWGAGGQNGKFEGKCDYFFIFR